MGCEAGSVGWICPFRPLFSCLSPCVLARGIRSAGVAAAPECRASVFGRRIHPSGHATPLM